MIPEAMREVCDALVSINNVLRAHKSILVSEGDSLFLEYGEEQIRVEIDPFTGYFRLDLEP